MPNKINFFQKKNRNRRVGSGKKNMVRKSNSTPPDNKKALKSHLSDSKTESEILGLSINESNTGSRPGTQPNIQQPRNKRTHPRIQTRHIIAKGGSRPTTQELTHSTRHIITRSNSRPTTQERSIELRRTSISRGSLLLDDIPRPQPPEHVEFSKYRRLGAIETQQPLSRVDEDSSNTFRSSSVVLPPEKNYQSYRESLVKHGRTQSDRMVIHDKDSREAWPRRDVPIPMYMEPSYPRRRSYIDPLHRSHNINRLRIPRDLDDRPKTSPEILERRPGSGTQSLIGERIKLRGPDETLKEIVTILNSSRTNSRMSVTSDSAFIDNQSEPMVNMSLNSSSDSVNNTNKKGNNLSMSFGSVAKRSTPPVSPPSPGTGAFRATGSKEHRDILRQLIPQLNGTSSRKSTPEELRKNSRRPHSGRAKATLTPPRFPPVTPTRKKRGKRPRCHECGRHLKLTATYSCRCGNDFCDKHRLSETHSCSFDYRSEGRRLLQISNPLITPQRLPKI